ncbi:MAG TPA: phenylalanine 4-monooxygenase [Myxococcales bacterium]|nr:phenylalanine 4-monooxygenase [Deltaproteobacteria bacterium]MBU54119.1 phenylalanine 4-monooxygenase [Deltaproteobacteria bacterium]HAA55614.1 phenylalanine 4-monooxygenase [Myxococcales bacterium]|tara:strand:+ start:9718 stop:10626 length:909 start_codon:yes stop_codon:yes gene_type:complete
MTSRVSVTIDQMSDVGSTANSLISLDRDQRAVVELDPEHPGFRDMEYRERRNQIAQIAMEYIPGEAVPDAPYVDAEHNVWKTVWEAIDPVHEKHACQAYLDAKAALDLPKDHLPQLNEVSAKLQKLSGFRLEPAAGLVEPGVFLAALAEGTFMSTQYIRHPSAPLYTPEPDVVHEIIGHAVTLANPDFAELNRLVGQAALRCKTSEELDRLGRIYWYTIEFGVLREKGEVKAYGAGLLSSAGELEQMPEAEIRPFNLEEMEALDFDVTVYQPVLFCADSQEDIFRHIRPRILRFGESSSHSV